MLDHSPLSKAEKQVISENRVFTIRPIRSTSGDDVASLMDSVRSDLTSTSTETILDESQTLSQCSDLTESVRSTRTRKKICMKEAVISDEDQAQQEVQLGSSIISNIGNYQASDLFEGTISVVLD